MPVEVIAEVVRSGFVEGHHYGSLVAVSSTGEVLDAIGEVDAPILPRSCNKPLQALGMLHAGLDLDGELLALACASHSGEPFHVEGVRRILARAGLSEADLQNVADLPLDDQARNGVLRSGGAATPVLMNCSGKHAAMLATCVARGWDTATYLDPQHPLQQAIAHTFADMTGEAIDVVAVDGCGAPLLATSLTGLARAFGRIVRGVNGQEDSDAHSAAIAGAIVAHPEYVSGTRRDELTLLRAIPGSIGKAGAESCYVVAVPDGRAFAMKTDDGGIRARPVAMAAFLARHGVDHESGVDGAALRSTGEHILKGGGRPVGEVRAVLPEKR